MTYLTFLRYSFVLLIINLTTCLCFDNGQLLPHACTMEKCFDWSKCDNDKPPKVYVYPTLPDLIISPAYQKILKVIRQSIYYTENPDEACIFILSVDTTDRDRLSERYIKGLQNRISQLPKKTWNNGRNHLIFNLYYGSYPDYSQRDIGFDPGYAMIAWASANEATFRPGFDLSLPLFHPEHPLRSQPTPIRTKNPDLDRHLVSFKGKRYVYGIGSRTRDMLHHLHNANSSIVATTCRHNTDWEKFKDGRCENDNKNYELHDYQYLLHNSAFCLTPRGRRLGSYRFLEALSAGCIPVVLSDGWVLPFDEVIDWKKAALQVPESQVFFVTDDLSQIPNKQIVEMSIYGQLLFHRFFGTIDKIVTSAFQVLVLWPKSRGQPPEGGFDTKRVYVIQVKDNDQNNIFNLNLQQLQLHSNFLITIDERMRVSHSDVKLFMNRAIKEQNRLITAHGLTCTVRFNVTKGFIKFQHNQQYVTVTIDPTYNNNNPKVGLLNFAVFPTMFVTNFKASTFFKTIAESVTNCFTALFNFQIAEWTLSAPIVIRNYTLPTWVNVNHYNTCLNKLLRVGDYYNKTLPLI